MNSPADEGVERVICVVARDVLSLPRDQSETGTFAVAMWRDRWLIAACIAVFALLALAYAFLATPWYTAEVVLSPAESKNSQGLGSRLADIGLLGGLAGLTGGGSQNVEPIAVLRSRDFARSFIDDEKLLHVLLADEWDAAAGRWKISDPSRQPDVRDAIDLLEKQVLQVNEDKKTGLVTVDVHWKSAALAAAWANELIDRLNERMRARSLAEGEANVAYLQKELAGSNIVGVQQALSRLLDSELQKIMVARGDRQFAFRIVDRADVPKWRSWPKRRAVLAIGLLAGALVGVGLVSLRELSRGRARTATA